MLTPGPFGPGTSWREERVQPGGGTLTEEFLVVEALAPQRLVLCSSGAGADYRITWSLRPVRRRRRGCTAITVSQEAVPTAPYGRVVALLLGGLAARAVEAALWRDLADLAVGGRCHRRRRSRLSVSRSPLAVVRARSPRPERASAPSAG